MQIKRKCGNISTTVQSGTKFRQTIHVHIRIHIRNIFGCDELQITEATDTQPVDLGDPLHSCHDKMMLFCTLD